MCQCHVQTRSCTKIGREVEREMGKGGTLADLNDFAEKSIAAIEVVDVLLGAGDKVELRAGGVGVVGAGHGHSPVLVVQDGGGAIEGGTVAGGILALCADLQRDGGHTLHAVGGAVLETQKRMYD